MKIVISNNLSKYWYGKSDGIQFINITEEDKLILIELCNKYNKQFEVFQDLGIVDEVVVDDEEDEDTAQTITSKKEKKVWINDGKNNKKVKESELSTFTSTGWKVGRKK